MKLFAEPMLWADEKHIQLLPSASNLFEKPFDRRRYSEWPEQGGVGEDWHQVLTPFPYECSKLAATSLMWLWLWNRNASKTTVPTSYASVARWLLMKDDLSHLLWSCMTRSKRTATRGWHLVGGWPRRGRRRRRRLAPRSPGFCGRKRLARGQTEDLDWIIRWV